MDDVDKILFLDIDGVLNSAKFFSNYKPYQDLPGMDPNSVSLLVDIIQKTGCKIVLSSNWRYSGIHKESDYALWLEETDPSNTVINSTIDVTPVFDIKCRADEIAAWIDSNNYRGTFVIVDDIDDMYELAEYHVRTNIEDGLTRELANDIIAKLSKAGE